MKKHQIIQNLIIIFCIFSTCMNQQPPILYGGFEFRADQNINGRYGNLDLYWNNQKVLYAQDIGVGNKNYTFYVTPKKGANILSFVMNKNSNITTYIDNVYLKIKNGNSNNLIINGDFQNNGGWVQLNRFSVNKCINCTSKWISLTQNLNTVSQVINFSNSYIVASAPINNCFSGNTYILSFDYAARVSQNIASAQLNMNINGINNILAASNQEKNRYFSFVCGNSAQNYVNFTKPTTISTSTFTMDNVVFIKNGNFYNLISGGDFETPVNFCGTYSTSNLPVGWKWQGAFDLVAGCVVSSEWDSVVLQVGKQSFWFTF